MTTDEALQRAMESERMKAFTELCIRSWRRQLIELAEKEGEAPAERPEPAPRPPCEA